MYRIKYWTNRSGKGEPKLISANHTRDLESLKVSNLVIFKEITFLPQLT